MTFTFSPRKQQLELINFSHVHVDISNNQENIQIEKIKRYFLMVILKSKKLFTSIMSYLPAMSGLRVLVGVKRVIDYAVKIRVRPDSLGKQ